MRKRGRGAMIAVFLVALVLFGAIYGAWTTVTTIFEPPNSGQTQPVMLTIRPGETTPQIADDLYSQHLIRNSLAFSIWARIQGLDTKLEAGTYILTPGMSIDAIIAKLQNGQPDDKPLLVLDGWRLEQIANQVDSLGLKNFNKQDFLNYVHHPDQFPDASKYPILKGKKNMEGLLFPDTYAIPVNYNTVQIMDKMLDEFITNIQPLIDAAKKHQLDEYQMVILASIVQREAANAGQMPKIAGIYWNRLMNPDYETVGLLQADPTVIYAYDTDHPPTGNSHYWRNLNDLGNGDMVDPDSPWNTYTHKGLPPTPISSPNLKALQAASAPAKTDCFYFYNRPKDGALVCEATLAKIQADEARDHLNQ